MGIIRGGLFVVLSVLFFTSLLIGNTLLTLNLSLDYETIKPEITFVVKELIEKESSFENVIDEVYPAMELYCQNNSEFVFSEQGQTFVISCEAISQGKDSIIEEGINNAVENIYYKEYDCDFWNCLGEQELPLFLISEKAKNYWQTKFCYVFLISLILIVLMFIFISSKTNLPLVIGSLLIVSSLPFMKLKSIISYFSDNNLFELFAIFFSKSYFVFLIVLVIGIIILGLGILLKFFGIGFKINNLIQKFSKKSNIISKEKLPVKIAEIKKPIKKEIQEKSKVFSSSEKIIDKIKKPSKSVGKK